MKKAILLTGLSFMLVSNSYASEDTAFTEGKKLLQDNCLVCHNAQLDPPQAPPMFAVQMKYKKASSDKESFVNKVTSFATHPSEDKAIIKMAVKKLGVMPDMGFKEEDVRKIASYIYDETFSPPCSHWKSAMKVMKENGDMKHYKKVSKRYSMMCLKKTEDTAKRYGLNAPVASPAEEGTLKSAMQQLGKDYAILNHAILMEDFDTAANAASHIANHEKPSVFQRMKIMAGLGTDMPSFKKADGKVHQLALDIEAAAKSKDMPLLIQHQSNMLKACMACHRSYRTKVIDFLK
ncbi:MAG: cytochrome c [Mariprofundaceae bacterium]|nr:cytochrome c [Mariprofundaceae bacterium]